jgi:hypothetical protein
MTNNPNKNLTYTYERLLFVFMCDILLGYTDENGEIKAVNQIYVFFINLQYIIMLRAWDFKINVISQCKIQTNPVTTTQAHAIPRL